MYPCLCCLNTACVQLKTDKNGRPYTTCRMCGSRTFMHSNMALRGLTHFAPQLIQMWRQQIAATDTMQQLDRRIEASQRKLVDDEGKLSGVGG